jgi:hypothetical protein
MSNKCLNPSASEYHPSLFTFPVSFPQFTELNDDIMILILSFVADAPFELDERSEYIMDRKLHVVINTRRSPKHSIDRSKYQIPKTHFSLYFFIDISSY